MTGFTQQIINDLSENELVELQHSCYIFPTRRGGIHFENELAKKYTQQTFWAPGIMDIADFVEEVIGRKKTDDMTLLFELYDVYLQFDDTIESFEKFYPWGEIILKDFDEIDKYLVDAQALYQNILEIKEIEAMFGANEEALSAVQNFRKVLNVDEQSELLSRFLSVWKVVGEVYIAYRERLYEKDLAYEGMLYRELVTKIAAQKDNIGYQRYIFCGFNALSNAEEAIFDSLASQERAIFYWDADKLMLENEWHETGYFLRKYKQKWDEHISRWVITDMVKTEKKINIMEAPKNMAQVKAVGNILNKLIDQEGFELEQSVVVLADENLLFPMLYALPEKIVRLNVSIGYPAVSSHLVHLINNLFELHITRRKKYFRADLIARLCASGYLQLIASDEINDLRILLLENRKTYLSLDEESKLGSIINNTILLGLFKETKTADEFLKLLNEFLTELFSFFIRKKEVAPGAEGLTEEEKNTRFIEEDIAKLPYREELDFIFEVIKHLFQFRDHLSDHLPKIDLKMLFRMFNERITQLKIPFTGETDVGLQMMGFLETRTLDFENLIILSVNEGQLPTERKLNSYIPYSLRKGFQMPTFEEQDAIYAYHFYRLLQRTKKAYLLFDGESGGKGSKERSRYLSQLERMAAIQPPDGKFTVTSWLIGTEGIEIPETPLPIVVDKTPEVLEKLARFIQKEVTNNEVKKEGEEEEKNHAFSPTSLTAYIKCPLQFYFNYLAELKEKKDFTQEIEANDLGNIVHQVLENLYKPYGDKEISKEIVKELAKPWRIKKEAERILRDKTKLVEKDAADLTGKNIVTFNIILQLVEKVLENDIQTAPFVIHGLEIKKTHTLNVDGKKMDLQGTIDRVDQLLDDNLQQNVRIIDYKTGKVTFSDKKTNIEELDDFLTKHFTDPKLSAPFQACYYAYLYHQTQPQKALQTGIFALKESSKGVQLLNKDNSSFTSEFYLVFEEKLKNLLREMMNPDIPFVQTEDEKNCIYCTFKEICNR